MVKIVFDMKMLLLINASNSGLGNDAMHRSQDWEHLLMLYNNASIALVG